MKEKVVLEKVRFGSFCYISFGPCPYSFVMPSAEEASSAVLATADRETPGVRVEVTELKRVIGERSISSLS